MNCVCPAALLMKGKNKLRFLLFVFSALFVVSVYVIYGIISQT